jgi:hypothetical protein
MLPVIFHITVTSIQGSHWLSACKVTPSEFLK